MQAPAPRPFTAFVAAFLLLLTQAVAHAADPKPPSEDARLAAFFEEGFQRSLAESPMFQSYIGMKGKDYGKWDDFSDAHAVKLVDIARAELEQLRTGFDLGKLSPASRTSYRIFEYQSQNQVEGLKWRFHDYAFSTMQNPAADFATFLQNVHRIDDRSDAEAYIARIRGVDLAMTQVVEGITLAAERGIVPTAFSFDPVLTDARNILRGTPFDASGTDSAVLADFRTKVGALKLADADTRRLLADASAALAGPFRKGVERFIASVESVRAKSPGPNGVWALPDGGDYYAYAAQFYTTDATLSPAEIHAIGLAEVKRIRGEMEGILRRTGFKGDMKAFFEFLRTDPGNFFPDSDAGRQAYLDQSKAYIDGIYKDVSRYFNVLPKAPLEVRRVEAWRESTAPIAFYEQPTPDGTRPGAYYVNLMKIGSRQKHEMETVAYHEGAPGHHFQVAIQQELQDVPKFQQFAYFGAYIEGWGLYAERLAKEQGHFTDPMQDFGRLQNEMLRAARLVVDTGGHSMKWNREQMIDFMLDNNPMTRPEATKEVERYLDTPGQALSYKIGMLRILDLRERARKELGERFDIRAFHDVVLKSGAVPLPVLETMVKEYIAAAKAA